MAEDYPPFTSDGNDSFLADLVAELLEQGTSEDQLARRLQETLPQATAAGAAGLLDRLKTGANAMFADRRRIHRGFVKRQRQKWGKPLDQLLMLIEASCEAGEQYNEAYQVIAEREKDYCFDALRRLHARACLVASEILSLMENGYASGAMARWRTLHELAVVGRFLRDKESETAERYLLHHIIDSCKAAAEYQNHCSTLGYQPFSADEIRRMEADRDKLCERFGREYKEQWGWAAEALGLKRPTFADIEAAVSFDHHRPFFKMACHPNHAGSKGIQFDLGNALVPHGSRLLLSGPSDAGLFDPGACTAVSLLQITVNLILYRDDRLTSLVVAESLNLLTDEILESLAAAEAELAAKAAAFQRDQPLDCNP